MSDRGIKRDRGALTRLLPRNLQAHGLVTPGTILRWHRRLNHPAAEDPELNHGLLLVTGRISAIVYGQHPLTVRRRA